tara:strand:- start:701 stop:829 length:129 start_codon:yes stop_codon:yes gene_type:complete
MRGGFFSGFSVEAPQLIVVTSVNQEQKRIYRNANENIAKAYR